MMARKDTFCVVYRTGGTENFRWHRTIPDTKEETQERLVGIRAMGYRAYTEIHRHSVAIGLPETYE